MTISVVSVVGTDTGEANYSASGTVTESANITTAIGDVVFVHHFYAGGAILGCTLSGGTGSYTTGTAQDSQFGNVAAEHFYRMATAAETFKVTATLASAALSRKIVVAVLRSSNGSMSFHSSSSFKRSFDVPANPGTNTHTAQSVPGNSIIIFGAQLAQTAITGAGSGYTAAANGSDTGFAIYQINASAGSTSPAFTTDVTAFRALIGGFVFVEPPTLTYARPSSDITKQWTPSSGTDHFAMIDEVTASDADYISATAAGQTTEVKLAAMTQPQAGTSVAINYRVQGITGAAGVTVSMVQGTTVIATDANRTANGNYVLTVAPATWASVTDWTDIRLRFVST
jgi:hypothetical protein